MSPKLRAFMANALVLLVVLGGLYTGLEWGFLRLFPHLFPFKMVQKFDEPEGIWPALQSSKRDFIPQDYLALAGDSYAMGMGDAMLASGDQRRPQFSSADTIHERNGRDVIAFGMPGSGSVRGMISNPVAGLAYLRRMVDDSFPDPAWIIVYFYEGNDLTENWMYFERTFLPDHSPADYENHVVFDRYIREVALGRQHLYLAVQEPDWQRELLFFRFVSRVFGEQVQGRKYFRKKFPGEFGLIYVPEHRWQPRKSGDTTNRAIVNGEPVAVPDNLQGPALDLTPAQRQHALHSFGKALAWSRAHFAQSRFAVVYIPSVLSSYQLAGDDVEAQNYFSDTQTRFPVADVERLHQEIRDAIAAICREQGVPFADATQAIREAASRQLLHGPNDWNHFNREGYRVLGEAVVKELPVLSP